MSHIGGVPPQPPQHPGVPPQPYGVAPQPSGAAPQPSGAASAPIRDDDDLRRRALLIARAAIGIYLLLLLLNLARPKVLPNEPTLSLFQKTDLSKLKDSPFASLDRLLAMPKIVFFAVLVGIVIGVLIQVYVAITRPRGRRAARLTWATIGAMMGPFGLLGLSVVVLYPLHALACVPGTALVLVLLHNAQRFARVPLSMLLIAFGWGALIVFGLGRAYTNLMFGSLFNYMIKAAGINLNEVGDAAKLTGLQFRIMDFVVLHLSAVNALGTAGGIVLLMLLFRRHVTDAMTGFALGAAVGLGYNLVESALIMKIYGMVGGILETSAGLEYWIRQSIGLLGGQVTFGALLGAGLALAARARTRKERWTTVAVAFAISIGGATASEILSGWCSQLLHDHMETGTAFDTLVVTPFIWLLPQSPFIVLAFLVLRSGRRARAAAARTAVSAEVTTGGPAITRAEAPFLIDPSLRFWALVTTARRYGQGTARKLLRLQTAQLELAAWWLRRQEDGADGETHEEGPILRAKVMRLKSHADPVVTR
ncbi:PrsW family glutamic-type intramembrane protease [Spirillospora sp. CA-255316]